MTPAGRIVELARYRIPSGERALQAQRIDGRVAVMDVPVDTTTASTSSNATSQARLSCRASPANTRSAANAAGAPRSTRRYGRPTSSSRH